MARRVNTHPTLNIEHVNRWNARVGPDLRKAKEKAKKQDALDPMDDFIADTDPADKPIDEATIGDAVDAQGEGSWVDSSGVTDEWTDRIQYTSPEEYDEFRSKRAIYREYAEYFKTQELDRKELGLPRGITRDMLMQVGMMCDVDYVIDPKTKRAYFLDEDLNKIVLQTYHDMMEMDIIDVADGYSKSSMSRKDWIDIMVDAYRTQFSGDTRYTVLFHEFMNAYAIEEEFNDNGNPIGPYRDFVYSFNKVYKDLYKTYHPDTAQASTAFTFEELLVQELPYEIADREEAKKEKSRKAKARREANKVYKNLYSDEILSKYGFSELTAAEKFTLRDEIYRSEFGTSLYEDNLYYM